MLHGFLHSPTILIRDDKQSEITQVRHVQSIGLSQHN